MKLTSLIPSVSLACLASVAVLLSACGGQTNSSTNSNQQAAPAVLASAITTLSLSNPVAPDSVTQQIASPSFYLAPVALNAPSNVDMVDHAASARRAPTLHYVPDAMRGYSTRAATLQAMQAAQQSGVTSENAASPFAATAAVVTYTPAQIRAAYSLPTMPASGAAISTAQAAALGAGQTIYIVDAMHDPNSAAELAAFNNQFGLMGCTTTSIATSVKLPLAAAPTTGCQFSVVYSTTSGTIASTAPAYDSGWATEIALDVQWTHATAPMARIILIEAPDPSTTSFVEAISLANAMGPGAVSMSFGAAEGSWTASVDSVFTTPNMTYLAATGDSGTGVEWPSVSSHVLAVGGTTLTYTGSGARTESAWSDTGGGISAYTAAPNYQTSSVPGMGSKSYRSVADVSMNANPNTGQYLAVMSPGSSSVSWMSVGGTSLSTPQWAGIIAIANAQRVLNAKAVLGDPHATLYTQIAQVSGSYASSFLDVITGADGSCTSCSAHSGYDEVSGLGTPNASSLLSLLTGASSVAVAPVVTPETISAVTGTALSFTVSVTASNAVTYSLSGAPGGMSISSTGAIAWATPLAGTYSVTVTAKDSTTGLSGSGVYTVMITVPPAPVVTAASISGKVGTALSYTVAVTAVDPITFMISGAPAGLTISSAGVIGWASPVTGSYAVTVTATDSKTGSTGKAVISIVIAPLPAPTVTAGAISGTVATALSFSTTVNAPDAVTYTISGAPSGMAISSAGVVSWATPVVGTYAVTVTAKDSKTGLSGSGIYTVTIVAKTVTGPTMTASAMTGVAGKAMTGTITIVDKTATSLSVSISGMPMGVTFAPNGLTLAVAWGSPVTGTYSMTISVVDNTGATAKLIVPITITAK